MGKTVGMSVNMPMATTTSMTMATITTTMVIMEAAIRLRARPGGATARV